MFNSEVESQQQAVVDSTSGPSDDVTNAAASVPGLKCLIASLKMQVMKEKLDNLSNLSKIAKMVEACGGQKNQFQDIDSLRTELANMEKKHHSLLAEIENQCQEIDSLRTELETMEKKNYSQLGNIKNYRETLMIVRERAATQAEVLNILVHFKEQMGNTFKVDLKVALENCQQATVEQCEVEVSKLNGKLRSILSQLDSMEFEYSKSCDEYSLQINQIESYFNELLEEKLGETVCRLERNNQAWRSIMEKKMKVDWERYSRDKMEKGREEWICFRRNKMEKDNEKWESLEREKMKKNNEKWKRLMREKMEKNNKTWRRFMRVKLEKKLAAFKNSVRQTVESELKEEFQRAMDIMVSPSKRAFVEEQGLVIQATVKEVLADAKKQWQEVHERDIQQLTEEIDAYKSKVSSSNHQLCECKQKLHTAVSEMKRFIFFSEAPPLPLKKMNKEEMNVPVTCNGEMLQKSDTDQAQIPLQTESESDGQIISQFRYKTLQMEAPLLKMYFSKETGQGVVDRKKKEENMKRRRLKKERRQQKFQIREDQYDMEL